LKGGTIPPGTRLVILMADDDEDDVVLVREALEETSRGRFMLEWAPNFELALQRLREKHYDVVLLDYQLGAHSGLELLRAAKAEGVRAPILMLTGQGGTALDMVAMAAGAEDFLEKGQISPALLERAVRHAYERRRAEERFQRSDRERERLNLLFRQAPALINVHVGPHHILEMVHPLTTAALGGRDITGLPVRDAVPELEAQGFIELLDRVYNTGEPVTVAEMPVRLRQPDGRVREMWLSFTYQPWRDPQGRVTGVMTFAVDVTEQVRARQAVEEHVRKLQAVEADLQAAVAARDEFLTIASHELKTPLTPLQLQIDGLRRAVRLGKSLPAAERILHALDVSARQVRRLHALVENLLDVSRIAGGRLQLSLESFDLSEAAREVLERFRPEAETTGSKLRLEADEAVVGRWDRLRLDQVISNLLSNALKYGRGFPVTVSVKSGQGGAHLIVSDGGIGIPPDQLARIFGRYERAVSTRHYGGMGLGLYIAQQIVEAHGGTIAAQSRPGEGAVFTAVLPRGQ
jgi:PAS domain S-box-containing protein